MKKTNQLQERKNKEYAVKSVSSDLVIKDVDLTKRIVTGLYNTFNFFDSDYDVILPGAAQKSINERGPNSSAIGKIKHLLFHDWTQLPGKIQVLQEKQVTVNNKSMQGIYFETEMADTKMGDDTLVNYQQLIYDNHSIGFQFLDGEWIDSESDNWDAAIGKLMNPEKAEDAGFMYLWKEIKLYEGSTVAFGANEMTPYLGVKDMDKTALAMKIMGRINALNEQVRKGTQSDEMLYSFEMQTKQLKQIINELFLKGPSLRPTPPKGREEKDTDSEVMIHCDACGDFDAQGMQADADGAYACPNCNVLCMPGTKKAPMDFLTKLNFV